MSGAIASAVWSAIAGVAGFVLQLALFSKIAPASWSYSFYPHVSLWSWLLHASWQLLLAAIVAVCTYVMPLSYWLLKRCALSRPMLILVGALLAVPWVLVVGVAIVVGSPLVLPIWEPLWAAVMIVGIPIAAASCTALLLMSSNNALERARGR